MSQNKAELYIVCVGHSWVPGFNFQVQLPHQDWCCLDDIENGFINFAYQLILLVRKNPQL